MVKKVGSLELVGRVVSDKMMKTANVEVTRLRTHRLYNKHMRTHKKFKVRHFHVWLLQADKSPRNRLHALTLIPPKNQAHDEEEAARVGDDVRIAQCAPVSRHKHFVLTEIIRRGSSR